MQLFKQFYLESSDTNRRGFIGSLVTGAQALNKLLGSVAPKLPAFYRPGLDPKVRYIEVSLCGELDFDHVEDVQDAVDFAVMSPAIRAKRTSAVADGMYLATDSDSWFSVYVDKRSPAARLFALSDDYELPLFELFPAQYDQINTQFGKQVFTSAFNNEGWVINLTENLQGTDVFDNAVNFETYLPLEIDGSVDGVPLFNNELQEVIDEAVRGKMEMKSSINSMKRDLQRWISKYKKITGNSKIPAVADEIFKNWSDQVVMDYSEINKLLDTNIKRAKSKLNNPSRHLKKLDIPLKTWAQRKLPHTFTSNDRGEYDYDDVVRGIGEAYLRRTPDEDAII